MPRKTSFGVLLVLALSHPGRAADAPATRELLRLRPLAVRSAMAARPEVLAAREVEVRFAALKLPSLTIELPDGTVREGVRTSLERRGPADYAWRGTLLGPDGEAAGEATLTVLGNRLRGALFLPPAVYEIEPVPGGGHRLLQIDVDAVPLCAVGQEGEPEVSTAPAPLAPTTASALPPPAPLAAADPVEAPFAAAARAPAPDLRTRIGLLVLYTPMAASSAGGAENLRLSAQTSLDLANTAFQNSRLNLRLQLAGFQEVSYAETGDPVKDIGWMISNQDIITLRKHRQAGLVTLLVDRMDGACGIGQVLGPRHVASGGLPPGSTAVKWHCSLSLMVLAHEVGHNFGCDHDPANGQVPSQLAYPFAYAHFVDGEFRTVMSYATECTLGCPRIPVFGHPEITYRGFPTGIPGQRDSQRVINLTKGFFAGAVPLQPCRPGPGHLCLLGGRFEVRVDWENQFDGSFGVARAVPRTGVSGFFTFGDPGNLELLVKMLDFGDVVKLFYGQLTNLQFTLTVIDTLTGMTRSYQNGPRECGAIDHDAFPSAALLPATAGRAAPRCRPGGQTLCLLNNRFQLEVDWQNPGNGQGGRAAAVALSRQTGAFSFTDASNLELLAKIVDNGGRIDIFYGTLSDLDYTLRVTDIATGRTKTYHNPAGTYCGGLDVGGF